MDTDFLTQIGKFGLLPGLVLYGLSILIKRWTDGRVDGAQAGAQVNIIDSLVARNTVLEQVQKDAAASLDAERTKRFAAEDALASSARRVALLESQLKSAGFTPYP